MKNFKLLFVAFLLLGLTSCSSDDDNPTINIVGSWTMTEGIVEPASITVEMGGMQIPVEVSGNFIEIDDQNRLTFKEDNTFSSVTGNIAVELNLVVMGIPQTQRFEASDLFGQGTWELNGKELKIKNDNGTTIPYHIDSINGTNMEISANVKDMSMEGESNPILDSMDIVIKMKLKRV